MIKANFNAYNSYVTDSLYQWDKDQTLRVSGVNIAVAPEIHFTNIEMDRAIVRQGELKDGIISVKIPNSLLQSIQDIKVYIGVWEGSTFTTIETVVIPVIMRDKPEDYVLEVNDEEYYSFSRLENEIANMVTLAGFNAQVAKTEAEIKTKEEALKAQIANIIAHNNDTDGNTELLDIRTGADGTVYPSAGDAVRGQVSDLKSDLDDLGNDYINTHQTFVNNTGCDWTLSDVQNPNMCSTPIFTSKGKTVIKFDNDIVGIGLLLYVISETSGSMESWVLFGQEITETEYTIAVDDNVRVLIMAKGGMATYYDRIAKATTIYTLTDDGLMNHLRNKIIGSKKIWCFGDSLTAGVITGTTTIDGSYPYWLKKFLKNENAIVENFGKPGYTTQQIRDFIKTKTFYGNCDIAILMMGANGYMSGEDAEDTTTPYGAYHDLINYIINSSKGTTKIIIVNTPHLSRGSDFPQRWLDEMHYKVSKIANTFGIDCIDLFTYLPFDVSNKTYYSSDNVHFTSVGYYYIAFIIYNYLVNNMTNSQIGGSPTFDY